MIVTCCCIALLMILAYLLGSIPSAIWIGKHYYGIDIREYGSHNAGTTNMMRVLGKRAALPVFAIDFLKGFVAVSIVSLMRYNITLAEMPWWIINIKILAVLFAVLGHIFPVFASFRGGKGVATLVGAVTGIQPNIALLCFAVWCLVLMTWHYVSLASITAGCSFPVFVIIFSASIYNRYGDTSMSFVIFSIAVAVLLIWTHKKNIQRLKDGTESKTYIWRHKPPMDQPKNTEQ